MQAFTEIYDFALGVLYSLGDFCDSVFNFLTYEVSVTNIFGQFEYSVYQILFGGAIGVLLGYKIVLSLIPIV